MGWNKQILGQEHFPCNFNRLKRARWQPCANRRHHVCKIAYKSSDQEDEAWSWGSSDEGPVTVDQPMAPGAAVRLPLA
jgi:hypothetical protein